MKKFSLLLILAGLVIISASSFRNMTNDENNNSETTVMFVPQDDPADAKFPAGAAIYKAKCFVCHQLTGEGIPGAFPPLKAADYLLADKKRAVEQVLNGSHEEMVVNGATYNMPMPFQVDTHQEAVDVINYVLNAWGNDGGTISLDDVKDIKIVR